MGGRIKDDEIGRACGTYGAEKRAYRILVGKFEAKRPFGSPRHRWEANKKVDLKEIDGRAWTGFMWLGTGRSGRLLLTW
jgi:hypothetical protein